MLWFITSISAGLFFALARVIARKYLREKGNPLAFTAIHDFIAGFVLLPIIFLNFHLPTHYSTWLFFVGVVVFAFLCDWLSFIALKILDVSVYQIVNQVRHIFVLFGGFLLFQEIITVNKVIAVICIILGVFIVLYEKLRISWTKGVTLTFFATLLAVIAFFFAKFAVADFSEIPLASFELMGIGLLGFGLTKFDIKGIKQELKINGQGLLVSGIFFGVFEVLLFWSLKLGDISKVIPVTQSSLIFTVLIGILFLKERERITQKVLGMLVVIMGIILFYFL